jgi:hypothetical protein
MATFTSTRAGVDFVPQLSTGAGVVHAAHGKYTFSANPTVADIVELCWLPAGVTVLGGTFRADDIDTGTETLDIDIGWAANGVEAADSDGFGNFGLLTGDATTDVKPEVSTLFQLNGTLKSGPVDFTNRTKIQAVINAVAATFAAGTISVVLYYTKTDTYGA